MKRLSFLTAVCLIAASLTAAAPRHVLVRDFRTVRDGQVVCFNIGTAAHGPATLAVLQKHLPGVKLSLWADAPLAPELQRMMDRRFPDVKIHTGPDVPETDAELFLVGSGASIAGSVRRSIGPWRERTGRPVAAYAIGYGKSIAELTRAMSFCTFRDRTALSRALADGAAPAVTGFAPDAVFDFDAADEAGAAAFLKENGLEPGKFACAIPGQRATSYWIYFGGKRDERRETLNARHERSDNAIVCAAIVEAVRRHGLKVLLCAEHRGEMPLIERALLAQLPDDVKAACVPLRAFWSPDLALGVYRRSRCVFGIEMHSQVMAIGSGVPAVVMRHQGFGTKSDMWKDVGLGDWLMDIDEPGAAERAVRIVGGILSDEAAARAKVAAARAAIDRAADDALAVLRGDGSDVAAPLGELVPEPQSAVATGGAASGAALRNVRVERGKVKGLKDVVADEAYVLEVSAEGVKIVAEGPAGERNARTTLAQLEKLSGGQVPCCRIVDGPILKWRGFMIDVGRNYLDLDSLRDLIGVMAGYKLNLLHLHLTEYYAWRLQSKRHPELEEKGYCDPCGTRHRGKFYTQEEFRELVDFAAAHGVTVMPEFDIPGHAEAFRRAFGFKSMRDPGVVEVLVDLVNELCALAPKELMPFVHLGGDEVWAEREKFNPGDMERVAKAVTDNGRTIVSWRPGEVFKAAGPQVAMLWQSRQPAVGDAWFDARGWYIEMYDPFEILGAASYLAPFRGERGDPRQLGAIFCAWHDSAVGLPYARTFRDQPVFPACVAFGDLYWHGRPYQPTFSIRRLPLAGDPALDVARDLERRIVAQRDKVLTDLRHPFHFVRQTQMRWRLTDAEGRLVARDIAQGSVFPYHRDGTPQNLMKSSVGVAVAETWIRSPDEREIGAWIGFTAYDRDHGRSPPGGTPDLGQWNRFGAKIELNGEPIPPPVWEQPSLKPGRRIEEVPDTVYALDETPFTNDEWYMREPTKVRLRKGWNHVKMTMPMTRPVDTWTHRWVGTFMPVAGTTDHPREIDDLEYSSEPRK